MNWVALRYLYGMAVGLPLAVAAMALSAEEIRIQVDANQRQHRVSEYLTGACIEDVNHEIYGGIYSQMVFGESFQEPGRESSIKNFQTLGGKWFVEDGVLLGPEGDGPKVISSAATIRQGIVSVEIYLPGNHSGNSGLIIAATNAKIGADQFSGYEISLDSQSNRLIVGRHQNDFRQLASLPCPVPAEEWINLSVSIEPDQFTIFVDGERKIEIRDDRPLDAGTVGLRQWQRTARYRNLTVTRDDEKEHVTFESHPITNEVSEQWDAIREGDVVGNFALATERPFVGEQCQRMSFASGDGAVGLANRGLNRWGMTFERDKLYEGLIWLRAREALDLQVHLESADGKEQYAKTLLHVSGNGKWTRHEFKLTSTGATDNGRLVLRMTHPGQIDVGYVFLQPGTWGRFKGLPLRRDVVEGLLEQGITALRYGGSMVDNPPNYRWKNMIGPRDQRPPYDGHWYDYSTNGWGIFDFLNLCEAAGLLGIPCVSIDETPQDMVDFLQYVNGPVESPWGQRRAADGHARPYDLRYLQLGNEESVNEAYWLRFEPIARSLWKEDPSLILIVGDFQFDNPITDPFDIDGSSGGINSLEMHRKILKLAKEFDAEVWFDIHMWTDGPDPTPSMNSFFTYVDALEALAQGAKHRVAVFEFNANNHGQRRALSNAEMIGRIMRDGRVPFALSANCLQPDGQNDNGWDQGLLFFNSGKVWLQPPGFVTQMVSSAYQPWLVRCDVNSDEEATALSTLDVTTTCDEDGKSIVIRVVNRGDEDTDLVIDIEGFEPAKQTMKVTTLAAALNAVNTADRTTNVVPEMTEVSHDLTTENASLRVPPYSYTTIRIE